MKPGIRVLIALFVYLLIIGSLAQGERHPDPCASPYASRQDGRC